MNEDRLETLAEICGLQTHFWDWKGNPAAASSETVVAILAAMGVDASDDDAVERSLVARADMPWRRPLPAGTVVEQGLTATIDAHVPAGMPAELTIRLEDGGQRDAKQIDNCADDRLIDDEWVGEATFELPDDLPLGYHRLLLRFGDDLVRTAEASLTVSPSYLGLPPAVADRRVWGYAAQLYSVRSGGSWGVGDLQDLTALATWATTQQQADYVLINPLHAAEPTPPMEPSPYLPSTRRFINPLYIRPEAIPEYSLVEGTARTRLRALQHRATALSRSDRIERDAAWALKREALRIVFDAGLCPSRRMSLSAYRRSEGRELRDFAVWTVLCAELGRDWRDWPAEMRRPTSPEVAAFAEDHADLVAFAEWQQWIAQDQLSEAQHVAREAGMRVGVVTDLAVGVSPRGADTWMMRNTFADGVEVGAPPDAYNQLGQSWGQPPWRPDRLAELDFVPFRMMVRGALRHAGGVRMDHVMGLFRLWWVPDGCTPDKGCYVRYDHEAMVGILALEAHRAGAFVVGEDLGTVEPWVRDYLERRGILGTSVLWFEDEEDGSPRPPERWRKCCLASVTTHDLPPTAGFLALEHVKLRHRLGLLTEPLDVELDVAHTEQQWWLDYLDDSDLVHGSMDDVEVEPVEATVLALHRALVASPAQVLGVALVDAVGDQRTQNQPGTIDQYPNWRIPLAGPDGRTLLLEDVFAMARPMRLAAVMNGWAHVPAPFGDKEA